MDAVVQDEHVMRTEWARQRRTSATRAVTE